MIFLQADSPPPDSGLADTLDTDQVGKGSHFCHLRNTRQQRLVGDFLPHTFQQVATDNNITPSSDTMEDLSLQVKLNLVKCFAFKCVSQHFLPSFDVTLILRRRRFLLLQPH